MLRGIAISIAPCRRSIAICHIRHFKCCRHRVARNGSERTHASAASARPPMPRTPKSWSRQRSSRRRGAAARPSKSIVEGNKNDQLPTRGAGLSPPHQPSPAPPAVLARIVPCFVESRALSHREQAGEPVRETAKPLAGISSAEDQHRPAYRRASSTREATCRRGMVMSSWHCPNRRRAKDKKNEK